MRRLLLVSVVAAGLAVAGPAAAMDDGPSVQIGFSAFAPGKTVVLAGQTVMWHNVSVRTHTVSAVDGGWGSGQLTGGAMFSHRFDVPGTYTYFCQLHPFMRGEVDVARLLLDAPGAAAPGQAVALAGRAALPAGSAVTVEADYGSGFQPAATAKVAADGSFAANFVPSASATLRAVAGADASPAVQLLVVDRKVTVKARHRGARWVVSARVTPAAPGAKIVLQLRLRERFGWWPQQTRRLDRHSTVRFRIRLHRRVRARVALTLRDGATVVALSRVVRVGR
jgi:plastocyanin